MPAVGVSFEGTDGRSVTAGVDAPLPVAVAAGTNLIGQLQPAYAPVTAWASPATPFDARSYSAVTIAVITAPTSQWALQWSPNATNWFALTGIDLTFSPLTSIGPGFTGALTCKGAGFIRLTGGTAGSFLIGAGQ